MAAIKDTYANIVAYSPVAGDIAQPTDFPEVQAMCFSGGTWTWFGRGMQWTPPPTTGWSWVNQGTASISTVGPFQHLTVPLVVTLSIRGRVRTAPATPWTLRAWFHGIDGDSRSYGLLLREAATGNLYRWGVNTAYATAVRGAALVFNTSPTAGTTSVVTDRRIAIGTSGDGMMGMEVEDDGVNLYFRALIAGTSYLFHSEARGSRMAVGPDEIGFHGASSLVPLELDLVSWEVS